MLDSGEPRGQQKYRSRVFGGAATLAGTCSEKVAAQKAEGRYHAGCTKMFTSKNSLLRVPVKKGGFKSRITWLGHVLEFSSTLC